MKIKLSMIIALIGLVVFQINCQKISTVGVSGTNLTPRSTQDVLDHSYDLARNCTGHVEKTTERNPNARANCHMDQGSIDATYEPTTEVPMPIRINPPVTRPATPPVTRPVTPPVNSSTNHRGVIANPTEYIKVVQIFTQAGQDRTTYYSFSLNPGETKIITLKPGTYFLRIEGEPVRQDTTLHVDGSRGDTTFQGANYDFMYTINGG